MWSDIRGRWGGRSAAWGLLTALFLVAAAVVVVFGVRSYQQHAQVEARGLKLLAATEHQSSSTKPPRPTAHKAGKGTASASGLLPIGQVEATSPEDDQASTLPGDDSIPSNGTVPAGNGSPDTAPSSAPTTTPTTSEVDIAVLTPLVDSSEFGASVGFLLACNTSSGLVSAAAAEIPGLSQVLAPVLEKVSPECGKLSAQAVSSLNSFNQELGVLQGFNAGTAPYFAELNKVFATMNSLAPQLEPLSGTITGLGPLVDFFSGPPSGS